MTHLLVVEVNIVVLVGKASSASGGCMPYGGTYMLLVAEVFGASRGSK